MEESQLKRILETARVIAVVGASANPARASNAIAQYLLAAGYDVVPVNPAYAEALGRKCYPDLRSIPQRVDIVDIFRNPAHVMPIIDEAIAIGAPAVWMQLGVVNEEAKAKAEAAGIAVVMDRCILIEHTRLFRRS